MHWDPIKPCRLFTWRHHVTDCKCIYTCWKSSFITAVVPKQLLTSHHSVWGEEWVQDHLIVHTSAAGSQPLWAVCMECNSLKTCSLSVQLDLCHRMQWVVGRLRGNVGHRMPEAFLCALTVCIIHTVLFNWVCSEVFYMVIRFYWRGSSLSVPSHCGSTHSVRLCEEPFQTESECIFCFYLMDTSVTWRSSFIWMVLIQLWVSQLCESVVKYSDQWRSSHKPHLTPEHLMSDHTDTEWPEWLWLDSRDIQSELAASWLHSTSCLSFFSLLNISVKHMRKIAVGRNAVRKKLPSKKQNRKKGDVKRSSTNSTTCFKLSADWSDVREQR